MTTTNLTPGLDRREMLRLLRAAPIARIAFVVDEQPYSLPVNFACDEGGRVVFRTGDHSLLGGLGGKAVAVEVDGYDARDQFGWCVLVLGRAVDITNDGDRTAQRLRRLDVVPWAPGRRDRWFVVEPRSMSGRRVTGPNTAAAGWFAGVPGS